MKLFVTGTDTGVGKTFVTAAIAQACVAAGKSVLAWKPIETGCDLVAGRLFGADAEALAHAAGNWQTGHLRGMYFYRKPAAPYVAAVDQGSPPPDPTEIAKVVAGADQNVVLVEGAGGLRVPVDQSTDMANLAKACALPVLLVARAGLGTINHTILSLDALASEGLTLAGIVLSRTADVAPAIAASNRSEIERLRGKSVHVFDGTDSIALLNYLATARL